MLKGIRAAISALIMLLIMAAASTGAPAANSIQSELSAARDRQDLTALDKSIAQLRGPAGSDAKSANTQYQLALAYSYGAEVAMQLRDKKKSESYAQSGIDFAKKAVALSDSTAEYHRLLGDLCGQIIPANPLLGALKYGQCARDEISKSIQLDNKLALAYVSQGVGNYYLPSAMGGGVELALKDFDQAIALNPNLADAYLWKGVALRKANRDEEARQVLQKAIQLDPNRLWAKQQLEKTPAR